MTTSFDTYLKDNREEHLNQFKELLRFQSISTLSENAQDVVRCAEYLGTLAKEIGFENIQLIPTARHPVFYADWMHAPGKPTVLVYGHYDVQPVDPLPLWKTPPFEPDIRDGQIFARGSTDDKGPVFMHLKAFEALLKTTGTLPVNVKFCIEGEEEIGSPNLDSVLKSHRNLFEADVLVISDTSILAPGRPAVCYGLRGLAALEVHVYGAKGDLHSGFYGGSIQNPIHALTSIVASMHDDKGRVAVDGFYDDVIEITAEERDAFAKLAPNDKDFAAELGLPELFGEEGYTTLERQWVRPTLELNGIYGGFQGEGTKTVIPSEAHAKITCRLVPGQKPLRIQQLIEAHVKAHAPKGVRVEVTLQDKGEPYVTPFEHPAIQLAARAYEQAYGTAASFIRMGGSIPIVESFSRVLDIPVVMMGFGLPTENLHAPNEHFSLDNFDKGMRTLCYYWMGLEDAIGTKAE